MIEETILGRPLPHNRDAERSILGAIILDNRAIKDATEKLRPQDFFLTDHQIIFALMVDLDEREVPIDPILMIDELKRKGQLEAVGGEPYISELPAGLPRVTNVSHYAGIVKKRSQMREIIFATQAMQQRALDADAEPGDLLPYMETITSVTEERESQADILGIPDMPEAVLDGRLGEICTRRLNDLPIAYAWICLVTAAGTTVPRSPHIRTNLYAAPIGPVGSGKSQAIERSIMAIGISKPQLENTLAGSSEGLLDKLADANGDARLLNPDELGHLLTKAKIDGASFPFVLNTAFYKTEFDVTMARSKKIHWNCVLGIIGGVVTSNFESLFGVATTGGLHDRFIFGQCPRPFEFQYRPFEGGPEHTQPCSVTIDRGVWEARDEWVKTIRGCSPRCAENAIRVAAIAAAFSGRAILYAKHLEAARSFAEYQAKMREVLRPNPGENTDARCAFAILSALADDRGWNEKRSVARKIHSYRYGPSAFERAVNALQSSGDIDVDRSRPIRLRLIGD
jgi:hypothetical protein